MTVTLTVIEGEMSIIRDLKQKRAKAIEDARAIIEGARKEGRDVLNAEEDTNYNKWTDEADKLMREIQREERQLSLESELSRTKEEAKEKTGEEDITERAFDTFMRRGLGSLSQTEVRALQVDNGPQGGFVVAPGSFVNSLIKAIDNLIFIRSLATVYRVPRGTDLGALSFETDAADAEWTSELATGSETTIAFGKRKLKPAPLAKNAKISNTLLAAPGLDVSRILLDRFAYKFGVPQERGFMTGNGANQPLGVFTASNDGIPTSRDVSTDNTATAMTYDGLIECFHAVKDQYHPRCTWIFHRDGRKQLMKIKDGDGQYIYQPSVRESGMDLLFGRPVRTSEYCPNTFTSGLYVGIYGDFSQYWIAEAMDLQVQRLVELYAGTNQTGFIGRAEIDGMPVLAEAFARVKLG